MPGKHHGESYASRHRYPVIVGVVLACLAVTGVLAAVHNRPAPATALLVTPALTAFPSRPPTVSVSPSPVAATALPSASASPSPSRPPSARRSPSTSPGPSRSATRGPFTASYVVMTSRRSSFRAAITVTNEGRAARNWQVVVAHDTDAGVRVEGSVGARVSTSGNTITLSGGPLDGGDSVTFGYQASKDTRDVVQPTSCRVDGVECRVTVRRSRR